MSQQKILRVIIGVYYSFSFNHNCDSRSVIKKKKKKNNRTLNYEIKNTNDRLIFTADSKFPNQY